MAFNNDNARHLFAKPLAESSKIHIIGVGNNVKAFLASLIIVKMPIASKTSRLKLHQEAPFNKANTLFKAF